MWTALACLATAPSLILGLTNHSLSGAGVSLGSREAAGALLAVVLLASLGALLVGARKLIEAERRLVIGRRRAQMISRLLLAIATGALAVALVAIVVSRSGLEGTISHAWKSFTATRTASNYDPSRLLSTDSENRWVWWKEAAGAFSDRPVGGWGAGSFGVEKAVRSLTSCTPFTTGTGIFPPSRSPPSCSWVYWLQARRRLRAGQGSHRALPAPAQALSGWAW